MAKFTPGIGFGQASGSVAGTTYSRNRFGPYMRNRAVPVNPNTSKQTQVRAWLGQISGAWRGLTATQRLGWNAIAPTVTLVNSLGQTYTPSGFGLFQSCNLNNFNSAAVSIVTTAPTVVVPTAPSQAIVAIDISASTMVLDLTPVVESPERLIVRATPPLSKGIAFVGNKGMRQISTLVDGEGTAFALAPDYLATFGRLPTIDEVVVMEFRTISQFGFSSPALRERVVPVP